MTALFLAILNMSVSASVVALFVMLIRVPLKRTPKIYLYVLWGAVLFRLLCPISFNSNFSLMPESANVIPQDMIFYDSPESQSVLFTNYIVKYETETGISNTIPPNMPLSYLPSVQTFLRIAKYVWLGGVTVLLLYAAVGYIRLKKRVFFATRVRENIYETDQIKTPFVLGFICPKIYLPVTIDSSKHGYIIEHEQSHIRRRDYLIKSVIYFTHALHWFNPIIWISYFLMSKDIEMSCDEAVLQKADTDIREEYSNSLLQFSSKKTGLLYPLAFGENNVKSRIKNVLYFKKPAAWVIMVSLLVVIPFTVGFSLNTDSSANGQKIIDSVDSKEVISIGVLAASSYQALLVEDSGNIGVVIDLIKSLAIQKMYFPINNTSGQLVQYELYCESDKVIVIGIYKSHIVINGQWYIANVEICNQLSVLGVRLVDDKMK